MMKDNFSKYINKLESHFKLIETKANPPIFIKTQHGNQFRYNTLTRKETIIVKSARYISGLNAGLVLLNEGFIEELGAICRILQEIYDDVLFLSEGYPSLPLTKDQKRFMNDFLQEEFDIPDNPLKSHQKRDRVPRKNIFKSIGRYLSGVTSYEKGKELHRTIYLAYSGYVHCAYTHCMEMYGGNPAKYHLNGMKGTSRISEWEEGLKPFLHRGINMFLRISQIMELPELETEIRTLRHNFESEFSYLNKSNNKTT